MFKLFFKRVEYFFGVDFSCHPATFNTYVPYTSRKHILSFMFSLLAIQYFMKHYSKGERGLAKSYLFHFFSLLSQPINAFIFIPLAYILYWQKKYHWKKILLHTLPYIVLTGVVGFINVYYHRYVHYAKATVFNIGDTHDISKLIFAPGFHFRHYIMPFFYARFYSIAS